MPPSGDDLELVGSLRGLAGHEVMDEAVGLDAGGQFGPARLGVNAADVGLARHQLAERDGDFSGIHGLAPLIVVSSRRFPLRVQVA